MIQTCSKVEGLVPGDWDGGSGSSGPAISSGLLTSLQPRPTTAANYITRPTKLFTSLYLNK